MGIKGGQKRRHTSATGGVALPSGTTVKGRLALRAAITNHRSRREDFKLMVEHVKEIGKTLLAA